MTKDLDYQSDQSSEVAHWLPRVIMVPTWDGSSLHAYFFFFRVLYQPDPQGAFQMYFLLPEHESTATGLWNNKKVYSSWNAISHAVRHLCFETEKHGGANDDGDNAIMIVDEDDCSRKLCELASMKRGPELATVRESWREEMAVTFGKIWVQ